jgi:hypothetical protein
MYQRQKNRAVTRARFGILFREYLQLLESRFIVKIYECAMLPESGTQLHRGRGQQSRNL